MVTLLMVVLLTTVFVIRVFVTLVLLTLVMRMPSLTTGGAPVTTAGAVPIGAGTMRPYTEPGGGGTKTPSGPLGGGPGITPGKGVASVRLKPSAGATKDTLGAAQKPLTKTTWPPRCS